MFIFRGNVHIQKKCVAIFKENYTFEFQIILKSRILCEIYFIFMKKLEVTIS